MDMARELPCEWVGVGADSDRIIFSQLVLLAAQQFYLLANKYAIASKMFEAIPRDGIPVIIPPYVSNCD
jgi:hypothetical protein